MRLPSQLERDLRIDTKVARAKHEGVNTLDSGNFFNVRNPLDALDLGDDANVAVGRLDVEVVVLVQRRVGDAGREVPWRKGALADGA